MSMQGDTRAGTMRGDTKMKDDKATKDDKK